MNTENWIALCAGIFLGSLLAIYAGRLSHEFNKAFTTTNDSGNVPLWAAILRITGVGLVVVAIFTLLVFLRQP